MDWKRLWEAAVIVVVSLLICLATAAVDVLLFFLFNNGYTVLGLLVAFVVVGVLIAGIYFLL